MSNGFNSVVGAFLLTCQLVRLNSDCKDQLGKLFVSLAASVKRFRLWVDAVSSFAVVCFHRVRALVMKPTKEDIPR